MENNIFFKVIYLANREHTLTNVMKAIFKFPHSNLKAKITLWSPSTYHIESLSRVRLKDFCLVLLTRFVYGKAEPAIFLKYVIKHCLLLD